MNNDFIINDGVLEKYCGNKKHVIIPPNIVKIGNGAFYGNSTLESIELPQGLREIGDSSFILCDHLLSIMIPSNVTTIEDFAFQGCSRLTSLTLHEGLVSIGNHAFRNCSRLEKVTLPSSLQHLGDRAFENCFALQYTILPETLSIGKDAFNRCPQVTVESAVSYQVDNHFNYLKRKLIFGLICAAAVVCCAIIFGTNRNITVEEISPLISTSIEYPHYTFLGFDNEGYKEVIKSESELLKYKGEDFEVNEINVLLDAIDAEKTALSNYTITSDKFVSMWDDAQDQKRDATLSLYKNGTIELSDSTVSSFALFSVLDELKRGIGDLSSSPQLDPNSGKYVREVSFANPVGLTFNDIEVEVTSDSGICVYQKSEWKSTDSWKIKIITDSSTNTSFKIQMNKFSFGNGSLNMSDRSQDALEPEQVLKPTNTTTSKPANTSKSNNSGSSSYGHTCAASGCSRKGTHAIQGFSGSTEYYCNEHYREMNDMIDSMYGSLYD